MSDAEPEALPSLDELRHKVEEATELIVHLRESNHSLNNELTELRQQLEASVVGAGSDASPSGPGSDTPASEVKTEAEAEASPESAEAPSSGAGELQRELTLLRQERREIRAKVEHLLQQLDEL